MKDSSLSHIEKLLQVLPRISLPSQVSIRAWIEPDYPAVRDLALAEGWTTLHDRPEDGMLAWRQAWPALVAVCDLQIVGFLRAITDEAVTLYVADLLVAPAWRGRQIGTVLLEVCHLLYPTVRLDLLSTGHADAFYLSHGFRPYGGFRKNYM